MEDLQQCVLDERSALQEKINKLRQYIGDKAAANDHDVGFGLLKAQLGVMVGYEAILTLRINQF